MNSALIIEGFIFLGGLCYFNNNKQNTARKNYIILIITLLIVESGLRATSVGSDTGNYYYWFELCKFSSWGDVFNNTSEGRDPGFIVVMKVCQLVSGDFNFFLTLAAMWFFIPLGIILYRYSNHILQLTFAFTLYVSLFHIIALSALRQQIAMGFSFIAFLLYDKNRYIWGCLLLLLGSTIHASLLLFFAIPLIQRFVNRRFYRTIHFITLLLIPFVFASAQFLVGYMASFMSDDYYMAYAEKEGNGTYIYIVLMELLSVFCFIAIKLNVIMSDDKLAYLYVNLPLLTFFVPMVTFDGTLIRLGQYFTVYMMILFPYAMDLFVGKKNLFLFYAIPVVILFFLMFKNSMVYEFCF